MSDVAKKGRVFRSQAGSSLAEVLVTLGIVTGLMGVGVLSLSRGYLNLATAKQNLVNDLRRARMSATLKGAHYRFESDGNEYSITRLSDVDGDGEWELDEQFTPKVVELPQEFSVLTFGDSSSAGGGEGWGGGAAEFDSRGLLVANEFGYRSIVSVIVSDGAGHIEFLQIWPSGQVEAISISGTVS